MTAEGTVVEDKPRSDDANTETTGCCEGGDDSLPEMHGNNHDESENSSAVEANAAADVEHAVGDSQIVQPNTAQHLQPVSIAIELGIKWRQYVSVIDCRSLGIL